MQTEREREDRQKRERREREDRQKRERREREKEKAVEEEGERIKEERERARMQEDFEREMELTRNPNVVCFKCGRAGHYTRECYQTHQQSKPVGQVVKDSDQISQSVPEDSSETTVAELADVESSVLEVGQVTREKLMELQKKDTSLADLFFRAVDQEEMQRTPACYYLKEGLLMRKHRPADIPGDAELDEYCQILISWRRSRQAEYEREEN
ncbi:histone-lysine N-methyltransferase, H3 lysine-79 specific-like [Macrobrachium nipponense]|uniref:histone-lysine N-methyltransferase, H3 lysine-79 specific-like n=1 Tax=Macrobrachium nipponense TaxID=159736 RepID=UPI0030C7A6A3